MIYDKDGNILQENEIDLSKGFLSQQTRIKPGATPIDDIEKFAWDDEDYEDITIYIPYSENELQAINAPSPDEDRDGMLVDMEYRLTMLELGL